MSREDFLKRLDKLLHDLGKYAALPIRFLPGDASDHLFIKAVEDAVVRTRSVNNEFKGIKDLWQEFQDDIVSARTMDWFPREAVHRLEQRIKWILSVFFTIHQTDVSQIREDLSENLLSLSGDIRRCIMELSEKCSQMN